MDVDVSKMQDGEVMSVAINQRPVWIIRRTDAMLEAIAHPPAPLYDPDSRYSLQPEAARNLYRSIDPRYFVAFGVCTHLGCSPSYLMDGNPQGKPAWQHVPQLYCPCHGGIFDMAGRVFAATPPPANLTVPNYEVLGSIIRIHYPTVSEVWAGQG